MLKTDPIILQIPQFFYRELKHPYHPKNSHPNQDEAILKACWKVIPLISRYLYYLALLNLKLVLFVSNFSKKIKITLEF